MFRRRAHRHAKIKSEPLIERPSKRWTLRDRLNSPWVVIGQYVFNLVVVVMLLMLFGNQAQFTDYANGVGKQRDAENAETERKAAERAEQSRKTLCELIAALEADVGGELQRISDLAGCVQGGPYTPPASMPGVPIVPQGSTSTAPPTPGSQTVTGGLGGGNGGRESPRTGPASPDASQPTGAPGGGGVDKPSPPPSSGEQGDRGGLSDNADLCIDLLGCLI